MYLVFGSELREKIKRKLSEKEMLNQACNFITLVTSFLCIDSFVQEFNFSTYQLHL